MFIKDGERLININRIVEIRIIGSSVYVYTVNFDPRTIDKIQSEHTFEQWQALLAARGKML